MSPDTISINFDPVLFTDPLSSENQPINGGTTTLKEKCEAINYFQRINDFGGIAKISFQIGFEHPIDYLTIDEACAKVGVNTYVGF